MIPGIPLHRCTTQDCPMFGQPTYRSCGCHKTGEQMLMDQRDWLVLQLQDLRVALLADADQIKGGITERSRKHAMEIVRYALSAIKEGQS